MIGEKLVEDKGYIESHIVNHFCKHFSKPVQNRPTLKGLSFPQVLSSQNIWLTRPFEELEVEAVKISVHYC